MTKRVDATPDDELPEYALEFSLSKPIQAYGEDVSILKIRKPTGSDLLRVGNPVVFFPHVDPPKIEHDMTRVVAMVARLANVPSSSIERMESDELVSLAWAISPFFIPAR